MVAIPVLSVAHPELAGMSAVAAAHQLWIEQTRYLGVGAMLVGGAATLWRLRHAITRGIDDSFLRLARKSRQQAPARAREDTDLATNTVAAAIMLCIPAIFIIIYFISQRFWLSLMLAFTLVIIGFFTNAVAGYLTGIVGASNTPVYGVTIIVLLAIAFALKLFGVRVEVGSRLAVLAGAVVCTAAGIAGDSLHDLATGFHLQASPRALEIAVLFGATVAALVMGPTLNLLIRGYGIAGVAGASSHALPAPQAVRMAKLAQGVFRGGLAWGTIVTGAAFAISLLIADRILEHHQSRWRVPIMPVAIGLYLPFGIGTTILLGRDYGFTVRGRGRQPNGKRITDCRRNDRGRSPDRGIEQCAGDSRDEIAAVLGNY
jgi:putative OPT family oligopeptide transporter